MGIILALIIFVSFGSGCASTHKTTRTETTVTYPDEGERRAVTTVSASGDQHNRGVAETSETITTSETTAEHPGIISSTLHAVGYVISLPFIIIGGVFRMIFGG